ncbi:hypothetical protein LTR66_014755 [Elasticomyces elasticus]|nr:hypothetical protein LTR66_014755 [Elasticomyces elasticus]KAK4959521.1 hypothetical protein LTR28_005313 [Elasticomyces elasticus]
MSGVRDPAFWRRFSIAVHLDEEASLGTGASASPGEKRPKLEHAYVCTLPPVPNISLPLSHSTSPPQKAALTHQNRTLANDWTSFIGSSDSWLGRQQRKRSKRACICWAFWLCFLAFVAAIIVLVLWLAQSGTLDRSHV